MQRRTFHTEQAPRALGPYSQAVAAGDLLFLSGQVALDPATGELVTGGFAAEVRQVIANLGAVLAAADSGFDRVVRVTVYLTDLSKFPEMNEIYAEVWGGSKPARATVEVSRLPKGGQVEIDLIATRGSAAGGEGRG